ncbi:hypothetical protein C9374_001735 [Naegleria lovaniensis]|uniref:PLAC8 family protein n=1 Tax=Naegleria lovaniensis TaxID=51637 RepID=A0AA88GXB4_NAELO|nr:uncharacterized protein C9374_001735 [Naegleria lovaniensis]KAG2387403.1 hypothetical protein C9374_001735 [Naegleria lovaniensis]
MSTLQSSRSELKDDISDDDHQHDQQQPSVLFNKSFFSSKEWSSGLFREGPLLTPTSNSISDTRYFKVTPHVVDYDDDDDMDFDEKDHHSSVAYDDEEDDSESEQVDEFTPVLVEKKNARRNSSRKSSTISNSTSASQREAKIYQARGFNETLYSTCCLPCSLADVVKMTHETSNTTSWWCICCSACFFPTIVTTIVRGMVRRAFGIKGGCCGDCCVGTFCSCCASAQMLREFRQRGPPPPSSKHEMI